MNPTDLLHKSVSGLGGAQLQELALPPRPVSLPVDLTLALTRAAGTPGTSVAREVGTRLGWEVYDHKLLERMARDMGVGVRLLESVDERQQSVVRSWMEAWGQVPSVSESWYARQLVETIVRLGAKGRCVIVGRGAAHILPAETTLRVRLVGPRHDRITALAGRLGLAHEEAGRKLEDVDRERLEFVRKHFHKDAADPAQYDLVLNASRWSVAECADIILVSLKRMEARIEAARK